MFLTLLLFLSSRWSNVLQDSIELLCRFLKMTPCPLLCVKVLGVDPVFNASEDQISSYHTTLVAWSIQGGSYMGWGGGMTVFLSVPLGKFSNY